MDGEAAEAEKAKARLRQGIARSKALIALYRTRLSMLRKASPERGDRPLFQWVDGPRRR